MPENQPIPAPVSGELVDDDQAAVIPSPAEQNAAADRARGRTTLQVGIPAAVVGIGIWVARLAGLDLNPLPGEEEMPADVVGYFIALATVALAFRMNPKQ